MNKLTTIEEYIEAYYPKADFDPETFSREQVRRIMKGYARVCIEYALAVQADKAQTKNIMLPGIFVSVDKKSITNFDYSQIK